MARALTMNIPEPTGVYDLAGLAALLAVIGGTVRYWWTRAGNAAERITEREERYTVKIERRLKEMNARLEKMERAYGLVVGIAHVMVDDLIILNPEAVALQMVATRIRDTYPDPAEIPAEMLHLLHRLDAHSPKPGDFK